MEFKLGEGTLKHTMAQNVAKRKANSIVQSEVQIEELHRIRNLLPHRLKGGDPKRILTVTATRRLTTVQGLPTRTVQRVKTACQRKLWENRFRKCKTR